MIISNEVLKSRIDTLFRMDKKPSLPNTHTKVGFDRNGKGAAEENSNQLYNEKKQEKIFLEQQHQAHLVHMAQNFQTQMNLIASEGQKVIN